MARMWWVDRARRRVKWAVSKRIAPSGLLLRFTDDGPLAFVSEAPDEADATAISTEQKVLEAITQAGPAGTTPKAVVAATGLSPATVKRKVADLRASKAIQQGLPLRLVNEEE
jgi:hypothetical protein